MLTGGNRIRGMISGMIPGLDLPYKADRAQPITTAGKDLDDQPAEYIYL